MFGKDKDDKKTVDLAKVQAAVRSAGGAANVQNLSVRQNGTTFEVHGQADSLVAKQEAFKRIITVVGDTSGVVNSIQVSTTPGKPGGTAARPAGMTPGVSSSDTGGTSISRNHVVRKGETLGHIAQNYFGKASDSKKIFEANRDQLKDPDKIREGMTLKIPS